MNPNAPDPQERSDGEPTDEYQTRSPGPSPDDLSKFRIDVLATVARLDRDQEIVKGLEIKAVLDEYYGKTIHHGRLYPNLDDLVAKGLVAKGTADDRTNDYSLTRRGHRELNAYIDWLASMAPPDATETPGGRQ